jgi:hypothetical protein
MSGRPWLVLVTLASACGSAPARPSATAAEDSSTDEVTLSAQVPPLLTAEVALIDAGTAPRRTLRYAPRAGESQPVTVELMNGLLLAVGEMAPPETRTPAVRVTLDLVPRTIDPRGRMALEGTVTAVEVRPGTAPPAVTKAVGADLERLRNATFSARVSARGLLEALAFPAADDSNPALAIMAGWVREALRLLLPPLPASAVGQGARWQARRRAQLGPATADETAYYSLTNVGEGWVRLAVRLALTGGEQSPVVPGLPPGASVKVTALGGAGGGTIELDLRHLQPRTDLRWSSTATGSTEPAGEPSAALRMTTTVTLAVRPVAPPPAVVKTPAAPRR